MFNVAKQPQKFVSFCHLLVNRNQEKLNVVVRPYVLFINYSSQVKFCGHIQSRDLLLSNAQYRIIVSRQKSKGKKTNLATRKLDIKDDESDDDDEEEEEDDEEEHTADGALVKTYNLTSLRIDLILKQVLKQKRKKIEEMFYSNRMRVNGKVLFKKAGRGNIDDEIDLIKGISKNKPGFIEVARVQILDIKDDDDDDNQRLLVKVKIYKSLEIDNYPEGDKWKESEAEA